MGECILYKRRFLRKHFSGVAISKVGTWNDNFTYTSAVSGTYIVTGLETNMTASVSNGGSILYQHKNYHWCVVADLPVGSKLTINNPSACIMGTVPVSGVTIVQTHHLGKSNATARVSLSNQDKDTLFIGAASYIWHSCVSGSGRGVRAGGTDTAVTSLISAEGWNDTYGNWGNELVCSFVPSSSTKSFYVEGYLDQPENGNSCASWLFQLVKKSW